MMWFGEKLFFVVLNCTKKRFVNLYDDVIWRTFIFWIKVLKNLSNYKIMCFDEKKLVFSACWCRYLLFQYIILLNYIWLINQWHGLSVVWLPEQYSLGIMRIMVNQVVFFDRESPLERFESWHLRRCCSDQSCHRASGSSSWWRYWEPPWISQPFPCFQAAWRSVCGRQSRVRCWAKLWRCPWIRCSVWIGFGDGPKSQTI